MSFAIISVCAEDGKEICSFRTDDDRIPCKGCTVRFLNSGVLEEKDNSFQYLGFECTNVLHFFGGLYLSELSNSVGCGWHAEVNVILKRNRDLDYTEPKTEDK